MFRNKKTGKSLSSDFEQIAREIDHLITKELPEEAESKLGEIVTESFRQEQYKGGSSSKKWKYRKGEEKVKQRARKNILVDEAVLINSFETFSNTKEAGIRTPVPYAPVHNEGLMAGRGKGFKMTQRQFGPKPGEESPEVSKHLGEYSNKRMDQIMNK